MIKRAVSLSAKAMKDNISFTLMVISFAILVVTGFLQVFEKVKTVGPFMELFLTCGGLYFGRQWIKAKTPEVTEETKTEEV